MRRAQGRLGVPVGINIGKAKNTPLERAEEDYLSCLETLYDYGDYFTINVSSPNTKDLRRLQEKDLLRRTLRSVTVKVKQLAMTRKNAPKPVLLKVAPDLTIQQLDDALEICCMLSMAGIIFGNTTISREGLTDPKQTETGGYSGPQLFERALNFVRYTYQQHTGLVIIGVGGISQTRHAKEMLQSGADLLQVLTGVVYEGPFMVKNILNGLLLSMEEAGINNLAAMRGQKARF